MRARRRARRVQRHESQARLGWALALCSARLPSAPSTNARQAHAASIAPSVLDHHRRGPSGDSPPWCASRSRPRPSHQPQQIRRASSLLATVLVTFLAAGHVTERGVFLRTEHGHELAMVRGGAGWRSAAPLPNHLPRASALRTPCGMSSEVPARSAAQRARADGTPLRVKRCAG